MKKIKILLVLIISFTFLPQFLNAKENQIIVATESWPPFRIHEKDGYRGIDFELWREIEKRLNLKIKFIQYPWARILHNLESGKIDAMSGLAKRSEREKYVFYTSPPYYTCSTVFYVKKGNGNNIKTYDDLYKHSIAYVKNSAYFKKFDNDSKLNKHAITTEIQLLKMLEKDRVEIIVGTDCQADYEIKKLGLQGKFEKTLYKPQNNVDLYVAISKKSPFAKELKKINETIKQIIQEGKIKEYSKKYLE